MEPIIIKAPPIKKRRSDLIRVQPDASDIILKFEIETGYPATHILSEIVRQAAKHVTFPEVDKP